MGGDVPDADVGAVSTTTYTEITIERISEGLITFIVPAAHIEVF